MLRSKLVAALLGASLFAGAANATIISGAVTGGTSNTAGGTFVELDPNGAHTIGNDNFQTHNLYGLNEGQNIVIGGPLNVDLLASSGTAGVLAAGTVVASHYIVYDPRNADSILGNVSFDSQILALVWETANLAASDYLINNNVTYLNPGFRGLELHPHPNNDMAWISAPNQVSVSLVASTPGDVLRVLTAYSPGADRVPEPGVLGILGLGFLGLSIAARRRRK